MTDCVSVQNLCLHGFHGLLPEETKLGQKFYVDLDCFLNLAPCSAADDHDKTICYSALCDLTAEVSGEGPYRMIETLGDRIARTVLDRFAVVNKVVVQVRKPSAPIVASFSHVGITVERKRHYRIALSLGSNEGNKKANVQTALTFLKAESDLEIDHVSQFYRTAPWGKEEQDWFINACATGWTTSQPIDLLKALKRIELQIGRMPGERWGPRTIDIDLLFMDNVQMDSPQLTLPHQEMFNRAFVLVPLAEIAADHEVLGRRIGDALTALSYTPDEVMLLKS
ncbi:MAG: 2-amino-4-hydroxy-6-hydroxymethyldihydropteridine diphosphokinase [Geminicoccaceae bacterium]